MCWPHSPTWPHERCSKWRPEPTHCIVKTFNIEVQRVKAMCNGHGLVNVRLDAAVQPQPNRRDADDAAEPATLLSMDEQTARVFLLLLKAQIAEFDKKKAKSRF